MRILIVTMSDSIHAARWISQITDQGWDIHLFPSIDKGDIHKELNGVTVYHSFYVSGKKRPGLKIHGIPLIEASLAYAGRKAAEKMFPSYRTYQLARLIKSLRPDIVHSLEIQHAGYLVSDAKDHLSGCLPPWVVTCWGSDLYLFGRLDEHITRIERVLSSCNFFSSDCKRDYQLAKLNGFRGTSLSAIPGGGGFDLEVCEKLRASGPVSLRRIVMVKGYQGWSGRALVALRALTRCADVLNSYRILVFSAHSDDVKIAVDLMRKESGIQAEIVPLGTSHETMLALHGQARISLGVGISDGTPNSLLEAMIMGAFPIQSWTSAADEWIQDGITGFLVPPEDPCVIEQAVRRALADDFLVESAANENWRVALERLDNKMIKKKVIEFYKTVLNCLQGDNK